MFWELFANKLIRIYSLKLKKLEHCLVSLHCLEYIPGSIPAEDECKTITYDTPVSVYVWWISEYHATYSGGQKLSILFFKVSNYNLKARIKIFFKLTISLQVTLNNQELGEGQKVIDGKGRKKRYLQNSLLRNLRD